MCHGLRPASLGDRGPGAARTDEMYPRAPRKHILYACISPCNTYITAWESKEAPRGAACRRRPRHLGAANPLGEGERGCRAAPLAVQDQSADPSLVCRLSNVTLSKWKCCFNLHVMAQFYFILSLFCFFFKSQCEPVVRLWCKT